MNVPHRPSLIGEPNHLQCLNIRCHVTAATGFLDWLAANRVTLATCTQGDLDRWAIRVS
jgi:hypothetical protein